MSAVRYGMVGGGAGAFIGAVHRAAAQLAGNCELVAGAFSSDPLRAVQSGAAIGLSPERCYASWPEMIAGEGARAPHDRISFVAIVTPNHLHAPIAIAALEAGFAVLCDKPLADRLEPALAIRAAARRTGGLVGITHTYTGYPLVRQARALAAAGVLGKIRRVAVSYTQDWLSRSEDIAGNKQAEWRTDPEQSGDTGAFGDIGSHAFNLVEYITGERMTRVTAQLRATVPGRVLDDDGAALFELSGGGVGTLVASQVCVGDRNALTLTVYGDAAALAWSQEQPNTLRVSRRGRPDEIWHGGSNIAYLDGTARAATMIPAGHPEGYIEAFAALYRDFGRAVAGDRLPIPGFASLADGIRTMWFLKAVKTSSDAGATWVVIGEDDN